MSVLAIILGIFTGVSVALFIVSDLLKRSNDLGNSEAKVYDFTDSYVHFSCRMNRVNKNEFYF